MSEYTPDTEDVRLRYASYDFCELRDPEEAYERMLERCDAEFYRWFEQEKQAAFLEGVKWAASKTAYELIREERATNE